MTQILTLLGIAVIWTFILDLCGFALTVDKLLYRIFYKGRAWRDDAHFPPFDCSLCMTFWTGLLYLILTHSFTVLNIAILLCFAWLTPIIKDLFTLIKDIIIKLVDLIYKTFNL